MPTFVGISYRIITVIDMRFENLPLSLDQSLLSCRYSASVSLREDADPGRSRKIPILCHRERHRY
jgi:hypothetical protein